MLHKFKNPLIDNSQNYKLSSYIKTLLLDENYNEFYIATGYWDIPSVALIFEELNTFLERPDTKIKLLLGKDPEVQNYQLSHADEIDLNDYPASYIKYHLDNIPVVADYEDAISLLLKSSSISFVYVRPCLINSFQVILLSLFTIFTFLPFVA